MKNMSWVVVNRATGKAIVETFREPVKVDAAKYEVVPIRAWLARVNAEILAEGR